MGNRWLWGLGLLLVLAAGAVFLWMQPRAVVGTEATRILLLGLDEVDGRSRSDTMIVVQIDPKGVVLLSVPRDLRLQFPQGELKKVNAAYPEGESQGGAGQGAQLARTVVSEFLGVPIPYYVVVDFEGFKQLVDQLGGVDIDVQSAMNYDDNAQDLHISLAPGLQTLYGEEALQYARYRDERGDLQRIRRQQDLLKAIVKKQSTELSSLDQVMALVEMAFGYVKSTNLLLPELLTLVRQFQGFGINDFTTLSLTGTNVNLGGISYLEPKAVDTATLVDRWLKRQEFLLPRDVGVIVLNGVGSPGLARNTGQDLIQQGYQVLHTDNTVEFKYATSLVITMDNDDEKAKLVQRAIGGVGQVVHHEIAEITNDLGNIRAECVKRAGCDDSVYDRVDVVVIVGQDY
jgi:LCP family protein required for cell wall assembly